MKNIKYLTWFIRSDVELKTETCWCDGVDRIDGFKFYSKEPFSKVYQYHSTIGLENTYNILFLIQNAIKNNKKAICLDITSGCGRETIYIWRSSLVKAEKQIMEMISGIQKQY